MRGAILKITLVLSVLFCCGPASTTAQPIDLDEDTCFGRIVYVNQRKNFVVFNLGREDGVEQGMLFEVYRSGKKIGAIKAVKVRDKFSAGDIKLPYNSKFIKVGDNLRASPKIIAAIERQQRQFLLQEQRRLLEQAERYLSEEQFEQAEENIFEVLETDPQNQRALNMLSRIERKVILKEQERLLAQAQGYLNQIDYEQAEEKVHQALELDPTNRTARGMLSKIQATIRKVRGVEPRVITVDINAPKKKILPTLRDVLKDQGYLITTSDLGKSGKYSLQASKYVELPFKMGLITDGGAFTRNKIYYNIELKEAPTGGRLIVNRLVIYLKGIYDSEGQVRSHQIKTNSAIYKQTEEMASTIKYLAENL